MSPCHNLSGIPTNTRKQWTIIDTSHVRHVLQYENPACGHYVRAFNHITQCAPIIESWVNTESSGNSDTQWNIKERKLALKMNQMTFTISFSFI